MLKRFSFHSTRLRSQLRLQTCSSPVFDSHTVVDVGTMMVELRDAAIADAAVFGAQRLHRSARVTKPTQRVHSLFPLVIMRHLKNASKPHFRKTASLHRVSNKSTEQSLQQIVDHGEELQRAGWGGARWGSSRFHREW